jgi:hypothetical protein
MVKEFCMSTTMFRFEHEGKSVLGFNTGLNERTFAQAKASSLITEPGYVVLPDNTIDVWKSEGVAEINDRMIIWGPDFDGNTLDIIIQNKTDKDGALNALRFWLKAAHVLSEQNIFPSSSPRGAIIAKDGSVLFPPSALVKRCLDAEGEEAILSASLQYVHPDLQETDAFVFSSAAMLYHIFSGEAAFLHSTSDSIRSDIRQGNFVPMNLTVPELEENISRFIHNAMKPESTKPSLNDMITVLGEKNSKRYNDFFKPISDDEKKSVISKREQYQKRIFTKARRKLFFLKNKTAMIAAGIGFVVLIIIAWNVIARINTPPVTEGMTPYEILTQYYDSFGTMDHEFMDSATIDKAGKDDIEMIQNLFVITRVRQAYEMTVPSIPAQEWIDEGSPETETLVFGVSDLDLTETNQSADEAKFEAKYLLWLPESFLGSNEQEQNAESENAPVLLVSIQYHCTVTLIKEKDAWFISEIVKTEE